MSQIHCVLKFIYSGEWERRNFKVISVNTDSLQNMDFVYSFNIPRS